MKIVSGSEAWSPPVAAPHFLHLDVSYKRVTWPETSETSDQTHVGKATHAHARTHKHTHAHTHAEQWWCRHQWEQWLSSPPLPQLHPNPTRSPPLLHPKYTIAPIGYPQSSMSLSKKRKVDAECKKFQEQEQRKRKKTNWEKLLIWSYFLYHDATCQPVDKNTSHNTTHPVGPPCGRR